MIDKKDFMRVVHIRRFITQIETILADKCAKDLHDDYTLTLALERLIQNIGEATIHLSDNFKGKYPQIPWQNIAGMRHILVHGYDIIDVDTLWQAAKKDIYDLKPILASVD